MPPPLPSPSLTHTHTDSLSFPLKEGLIVAISAVSRASRTKKLFTPLHILLASFTLSPHTSFSLTPVSYNPHLFATTPPTPCPFLFFPSFVLASLCVRDVRDNWWTHLETENGVKVRTMETPIEYERKHSLIIVWDSSVAAASVCVCVCHVRPMSLCLEYGGRSSWCRYTMSRELREGEHTTEDASLADCGRRTAEHNKQDPPFCLANFPH